MSSFIKQLKHPDTGKKQQALCIDDYFGQHRYGYFFRKDGKPATWDDIDRLQRDIVSEYDVFDEDSIAWPKNV